MKAPIRRLLFTAVIIAQGWAGVAQATEVDSYTFADETLSDSAPAIETHFRKLVSSLEAKTMADFAESYKAREIKNYYFSSFESCILYQNCADWPKIERIFVDAKNSTYGVSHYNYFTSQYLAPVVNVCGVRLGADKLTHIFADGFRFFELWNNMKFSQPTRTDWDVMLLALTEERSLMGGYSSEVISFADVQANLLGLRLFRDLFYGPKYLERGQLKANFKICNYIHPLLDERQSTIVMLGKNAPALLAAQKSAKKKSEKRADVLGLPGHFSLGARDYYEAAVGFLAHPLVIWHLLPQFFYYSAKPEERRTPELSSTELASLRLVPSGELHRFCDVFELSAERCACVTKGIATEDVRDAIEALAKRLLACQEYQYGTTGV